MGSRFYGRQAGLPQPGRYGDLLLGVPEHVDAAGDPDDDSVMGQAEEGVLAHPDEFGRVTLDARSGARLL
jgi:hypothetical protein